MTETRISPPRPHVAGLGFGAPPATVSSDLAKFLARRTRSQLETLIETGIAMLDEVDPDPDDANFARLNDGLPGEPLDTELIGDDQGDQAWIEWNTMRGSQKPGPNIVAGREDDEDDDNDTCLATDDAPGRRVSDGFPGDGGDAEDGDPQGGADDRICGEYGIDQDRLLNRAAAFAIINDLSAADVAIAGLPDMSMHQRLRGRLSPRVGQGGVRP